MPGPCIFAILNVTEDSFSDGGRYLAPPAALARARALMEQGAGVLDIGGASSNPDAKVVPPDIEIARLAPLVAEARREGWPVSIDSFASKTQAWALSEGVAYVNDIQGFSDPSLYPVLAAATAKLVVMHSVQGGGPATRIAVAPSEIMDRIGTFFAARIEALTRAGVARPRLILDPGMGFFLGTEAGASLTVLRRLPELRAAFGLPLFVSVSRKSFLRRLVGRGPHDAGAATLAAELFAVAQGVDFIRTHEPGALRDALTVQSVLRGGEA